VKNMSEPVPDAPVSVNVRLDWSDLDAVEPRHVNQAIVQLGAPSTDGVPEGIYLAFGTALPPASAVGLNEADPQTKLRIISDLEANAVKVAIHGRFHTSRSFLESVIKLLQKAADQYDAATQAASPEAQGRSQP
jgi:hypothetical protein